MARPQTFSKKENEKKKQARRLKNKTGKKKENYPVIRIVLKI